MAVPDEWSQRRAGLARPRGVTELGLSPPLAGFLSVPDAAAGHGLRELMGDRAMGLRDRFVQYFRRGSGLRPPFMYVFGPLPVTVERWHGEGMADDTQWFRDVGFEGEPGKQFGNRPSVNAFVCPEFEPKVLDNDGRIVTRTNRWGGTVKAHADGKTMAYLFDAPVKDAASWPAMKERLLPSSGQRVPDGWAAEREALDASHMPCYVGGLPCGFLGAPRELFGLEHWLMSFYDAPRLAHDVLDTLCDLWCDVFARIASDVRVDFLFIWEDMCYRGGPLVSPAIFREFMLPRYKRLIRTVKEAGVPLVFVDTDGDCEQLIPLFIEAGVDVVFPFEVQAGHDVCRTRREFPDLGIIGGVAKTMPSHTPEAVDHALAWIGEMYQMGRYLPCSDHAVPPTVAYDEYVSFYRQVGELARVSPC